MIFDVRIERLGQLESALVVCLAGGAMNVEGPDLPGVLQAELLSDHRRSTCRADTSL